jgi:hypothetical protein
MMFDEGAEVTVTGTVRAADAIAAPFTGERCVIAWTHARVWDRLDCAGELVEELSMTRIVPFVLDTGAAPLHVGDTTMVVNLPRRDLWLPPWLGAELLRPRGLDRFLRSTFFDQAVVYAGEQITVRGIVAHEADASAEHGYRETATLVRLVGYPGRPLTISR